MRRNLTDFTQAVTRYRDIVDHTSVVMWMTDVDGNLEFVNRAYREFFGVTLEQVSGPDNWRPLVHPDDADDYARAFAESLRGRTAFQAQARVRRADGQWRWIESSAAPRFTGDGEFLGMVGSSPDITDRKQAESDNKRNEARLESLLRISQYQATSIQQLLDFALAEAITLTGSKIGYIHHYDEARKEFTLNTWSKHAMAQCATAERPRVFQLDQTGIWGEAVRQAKPIIINDFSAPNPLKRGCPPGHVPLHRFMTIPIFRQEHIVGVVAVANKDTDYDNSDIRQLTLLMDAVWKIADRTRVEEALQASEKGLRRLNATLRALSKSNQAMVRATEEAPYIQEVCNIVVQDCGFRMAWVGYAMDDECKTVKVIGHAGVEQGYLSEARITWDDSEYGRGPTGTAIRTGKVSICHHTLEDPNFSSWRLVAEKRGYASAVALPLIADGKCFGALSILSDRPASITEENVLVLTELADDLAHGITAIRLRQANEQTTKAMKAAKVAAEHASKAKDHFIAVLSHELRTPLNPVLATATMLRQDCRFDAETQEHLEVICRNAEMEARLIDDLLDVTRIEQGRVELHRQPVKLCAVIRQAAEVCMPDIKARNIALSMSFEPTGCCLVYADAARLQQVFWNLFTNAVKFTPVGGQISVSCRRRNQDQAVVEVTDNGEGIDRVALACIFKAFEQAERSRARQFGGLGLGLAICRGLVELHGGTIEAHSKGRGKGATFTVRLPLLRAETSTVPVSSSATPLPAAAPRPLRILLVEDHADSARIMARLLSADGHSVQSAADVATGMKLATEQPFDLLLSDLGLPDGTGLDLLRALHARGIRLPAIALSGYGQDSDIQATRKAGFAAHLTKPLVLRRLQQAIADVTAQSPSC